MISEEKFFTFRIPKVVYKELRKMSYENEVPMSDYVRTGLDYVIKTEKAKCSKMKLQKK